MTQDFMAPRLAKNPFSSISFSVPLLSSLSIFLSLNPLSFPSDISIAFVIHLSLCSFPEMAAKKRRTSLIKYLSSSRNSPFFVHFILYLWTSKSQEEEKSEMLNTTA